MKVLTTVLELLGLAAVVAGVVLIYVPAGFIVAGFGLVAVSFGLTRSPAPAAEVDEHGHRLITPDVAAGREVA